MNALTNPPQASLQLLRHAVATLAYRGGKAVRRAPTALADFSAAGGIRSPGQTLAHVGDLLDWALSLAEGQQRWHDSAPLPWDQEVERFFAALKKLDGYLSSTAELKVAPEKLFQGPIADALTHVGQINILRRLAGCPVRAENYFVAEIAIGRVGANQAPPSREF